MENIFFHSVGSVDSIFAVQNILISCNYLCQFLGAMFLFKESVVEMNPSIPTLKLEVFKPFYLPRDVCLVEYLKDDPC